MFISKTSYIDYLHKLDSFTAAMISKIVRGEITSEDVKIKFEDNLLKAKFTDFFDAGLFNVYPVNHQLAAVSSKHLTNIRYSKGATFCAFLDKHNKLRFSLKSRLRDNGVEVCNHCHHIHKIRETSYVFFDNGKTIRACPRCRDFLGAVQCTRCGDFFIPTAASYIDNKVYCPVCARHINERKQRELVPTREAFKQFLASYHDSKYRWSQPTEGTFSLGAEFETVFKNSCGSSIKQAREYVEVVKSLGCAVERDNTVTAETITPPLYPASLKTLLFKLCDEARKADLIAWRGDKCGLHIHVGRQGVKPKRLQAVYKFLSDNKDKFFKLSGRTSRSARNYADFRFPAYNDEDFDRATSFDRFLAVNLNNDKTIEFRAFRGTLSKARIGGYIDFLSTLFDDSVPLESWDQLITATSNKFLLNLFNISSNQ